MEVRKAKANGIEIAYETFGDPQDPPLVLIMGLGTQMLGWPEPFCRLLADLGYHVVRFDNRDVGLSTHLTGARVPTIRDLVLGREKPPYSIADMAEDTVGLFDALGLERVHLVGASMGGFIAQTVATQHLDRVSTLTLIMTSTGSRLVGQPKPKLVRGINMRRGIASRSHAQAVTVETMRMIGSTGFEQDEHYIAEIAGQAYDRAYDPAGYQRQLSAIIAQPNRSAALRRIEVPTLVIHGLHDPLVAPSGGLAAARLIRNAKFVGYSGMGHDLPQALWADIAREITGLAKRGGFETE